MADNVSSKNFTSLYGVSGLPKPDPNGDVVVRGNLAVQGGNITTSAQSASLFNTNAETLDIGGEATTVNIGANSGTTTVNNNLAVGIDLTVANDIGVGNDLVVTNNTNIGVDLTVGNDLSVGLDAVIGNDLSIGNDLTVGNNVCIDGDTITLRCDATGPGSALIEVNRGGGANNPAQFAWDEDYPVPPSSNPNGRWVSNCGITATGLTGGFVEIGPDNEDALITTTPGSGKDLILDSDTDTLLFRTGTAKTNHDTFNLINTTATTVNAFGAATSLNFGASTGTTTVNNDLQVNGIIISGGTQFGNIQLAPGSNDNLITTATGDLQLSSNSGNLEIQDSTITGTNAIQQLFDNSTVTTGSAFARATTVNIANLPTTTSTYSIFNGPTASGQSKTIAIGGAGTSGSTTNVYIGSGQTGANSTVHLNGNVLVNKDVTAAGALLGSVSIAQDTYNNTITTPTGSGLDLELSSDLNSINLRATAVGISSAATISWPESNNRTDRLNFQSSNGNTTGVRVRGANTTSSALAQVGAFSSSDIDNGKFINLRAQNSGTNPLRIYTGSYTAGVLGDSPGVAFVDNVTTYATVNPSGPTVSTDLTTKAYVDAQIDANTTYTINASTATGGADFNLVGSDSTTDTIAFLGSGSTTVTRTDANTITISSTTPDPTKLVNGSYEVDLNADGTVSFPQTSLGAYARIQSPSTTDFEINAGGGIFSLNYDGSLQMPYYKFPAADGTANQILVTDGSGVLSWQSNSLTTDHIENGTYAFGIDNTGVLRTLNSLVPTDTTIKGGVFNQGNFVVGDGVTTLTNIDGTVGGDTTVLTSTTDSLTWAHTAGGSIIGSVSGTWSYNADGTTSFPNYDFPYADGSANQVLKTDGSGTLSWITETSANTASTIVARDSSGDFSAGTISMTKGLVGSTANFTDWPNAQFVASQANGGDSHTYNIGAVGEAVANSSDTSIWGVGIYGNGFTNGATRSAGVLGDGSVTNTADTGSAIGVRGYSTDTHAGGLNIGLYGNASGSSVGNYALYMAEGNIFSNIAQNWELLDNNASALSIDATGKTGIIKVITTDGSEGVTMSGTLAVTGKTTLADTSRVDGQLYATRSSTWTPPTSGLTTIAGTNGIAIGSSGGGNGYSPSVSITYYSGDTTSGTNSSAAMVQRGASGTNSSPTAIALNQVAGSLNFDGYATTGWASTIATTGSGAGTTAISPLQIQGYAREAFTDSAGTVTAAGMGFRVRGFNTATSMSTANRINFIDHTLGTATYKATTFNIQPPTTTASMLTLGATTGSINQDTFTIKNNAATTTYATFVSTGSTIGGVDATTTMTRVRGASAGGSPSLVLRNSNTVAAAPATNDGTSLRYQTAGSNATAYSIADLTGLYSSTGDHQLLVQLANGDQTSGTLTSVTTLNSKVTSTTISAGTASATPGASTVATKLTIDASKITAAVPVVFPSYTKAGIAAVTGAAGWQVSISDSTGNGGRMAYWDTTNSRWNYVSDDTAV